MGEVKQIAFQLDAESLAAVDSLTPNEFASRAAVLREAVHDWLARRREAAIDEALATGYVWRRRVLRRRSGRSGAGRA